ncbi:MAG: PEGA domain-containing protein [Planctomycetota bacterium]
MKSRSQRVARPALLGVLAAMLLPACTAWRSEENVLITSDPLGARIFVDGHDTKRTTPARLAIGGNFGTDHTIVLEKDGFRTAARRVYQHTEGYTSKWIDGAYDVVMPPLPFFWTPGDFALPFGIRGALIPGELHVQLERTDAPLLGFDLLAKQQRDAASQQQNP